ncbi:hypothetical protein [Alkaliphilus oremlandii]|uniref:Uncharacterized protein n=1 Tax=Alkaliphilus oremlandii (strain OhILAs) TaxID=350688 RepID=A8MHW8_ALKOO|nr:hypothetical protein [Alkaliphilus oremlandii]ABW19400.1 hypothetical protein Clos_1860 [Alkaliphilus oremlandii OhILAs]
MLEAISYKDLIKDLKKKHGEECQVTVGILIGNAHCNFVKDFILSKIDQYHHRSNHNIDFYFPGYGAYWYGYYGPQETVCVVDGVEWLHSDKLFCEFIDELEYRSKWEYSGETELILINFINGKLDFSEVMVFWLDRMVRDEIIYSPANFFQRIFNMFKNKETLFSVSDKLVLRGIGNSIIDMVKDNVSFLELYNNKWFCTKNISQ